MKSFVVVYNSKSGQKRTLSDLQRIFRDAGLKPEKYMPISPTIKRRLKPYIESGSTIAVVGGDGTISHMAHVLRGSAGVLAPLPGGTLNHFAHDLGVPNDFENAVTQLKTAKIHHVDVASVNDNTFINNSSIGLYPASLLTRRRFEDRLGKWLAAFIGAMRALLRFRMYALTIDEQTHTSPFVFVGNNNYSLNSAGLPERRRLDNGLLTVYIASAQTRRQLCVLFLRVLLGHAHNADTLQMYKTSSIELLTTRRSIHISRDGEVERVQGKALVYRVHVGALKVLH